MFTLITVDFLMKSNKKSFVTLFFPKKRKITEPTNTLKVEELLRRSNARHNATV